MAESKLTIKKRNPLKGEDGSKVISVRIKDETIHRLDELAKETNRSRNTNPYFLVVYKFNG